MKQVGHFVHLYPESIVSKINYKVELLLNSFPSLH